MAFPADHDAEYRTLLIFSPICIFRPSFLFKKLNLNTDYIKPLYAEFEIDKSVENVIDEIIKLRKIARDNKDWAKSDEIRDKLLAHKIQLKDTKEGTTWQII